MKSHKEIIVLFFAVFLANSCCSQQIPDSDSIAQRNLVSQFFTWYIKEAGIRGSSYYQVPRYKKLSQTSYIFDINDLKKRLDKVFFFSEDFKTRQIEKLKLCNAEMQKISWDSEPESQFNVRACDYLWYDNWIGGQGEDIDGFSIISQTDN